MAFSAVIMLKAVCNIMVETEEFDNAPHFSSEGFLKTFF